FGCRRRQCVQRSNPRNGGTTENGPADTGSAFSVRSERPLYFRRYLREASETVAAARRLPETAPDQTASPFRCAPAMNLHPFQREYNEGLSGMAWEGPAFEA